MCGDCRRAAADLNSVQEVQIFPEIKGSARTQIREYACGSENAAPLKTGHCVHFFEKE